MREHPVEFRVACGGSVTMSCSFRSVAPSRSRRLHCSAFAAASSRPASGIASRHFRRRRTFSRKKYRCKKSTLQLSSYVVESGVFSHHEASFYAGFCRV
ncbi:hypothetical protein [Burkholderia sp. ABCPW 11]|uniref:hypothetical protein n=1 Tax=Burkholderia sp. ABCPW 11 TaxID=1637859 RepID=UPI000AB75155|nr:hypothetical protein [Burkholderia sp. ABCPW 11]